MKDLYVSRTKLPPLEEYTKQLKKIWKSNWLTNNGELVQELEKKLQEYWNVKHVVCVDHGTSALKIALKAINTKEIYMSPFNYVAAACSAEWLGITPRYVDFGEKYGTPALVTHNYGFPCIVDSPHVIYDASHAFAVEYDGKSIVHQGDCTIISFHAVKMFQCVEGGALVTNRDDIAEKARWMRDFGHNDKYTYHGVGTNFKMSEFHAAMGLCALPMIPKMVEKYSYVIDKYNKAFGYDYGLVSYYPIWLRDEAAVIEAMDDFEDNHIYPRRYFYPALNRVFGGRSCPKAEKEAERVLAIPLYHDLSDDDISRVISIAIKYV